MPDPIAITGTGIVTALGAGTEKNSNALLNAETGIRSLDHLPHDKYITNLGAAVPDETLDDLRNDLSRNDLSKATLLATWAGKQALTEQEFDPKKTALILSTTKADFEDLENVLSEKNPACTREFNSGIMANNIAQHLNIQGPAYAISNACASGLIAIIQGARLLQRNAVDHALIIGVDILSDFVFNGFSCLRALSPNPARPFDEARDGLSLGEGAAAVLLSRADAAAPDSIQALINGWGATNDAAHITAPSREGEGLQHAINNALDMADQSPDTIGFINAHGTGTVFNDEMESHAVAAIFKQSQPFVTSMKGSIGHTLGAAGVIETVLCLPILSQKIIPPSVGFSTLGVPNELNIPTSATQAPDLTDILCMKSGFGGVNAALLLHEGAGQ